MAGPAMVSVAALFVVGDDGSPAMEAPGGTKAPMSRPFGPVPMPRELTCSRKSLVKVENELVQGLGFTKTGSPTMLPAPGQLVGSRQWSTSNFMTPLVKFSKRR